MVCKKWEMSTSEESVRNAIRESVLLLHAAHPNVVSFHGICINPPSVCLLMEYCERGDLRKLILDSSVDVLPISRRVQLALDVAQGMEALHRRDIVHRDLKTENILVTKDWVAKIADFGTARCVPKDYYMTCNIGTPYIRAPELVVVDVEGERTYQVLYDGERADSFSFGFLLYELLSRVELPRVRLPRCYSLDAGP